MFEQFRYRLAKWIAPVNKVQKSRLGTLLGEDEPATATSVLERLNCQNKMYFTVFFADGGFVIQSCYYGNSEKVDDSPRIHLVNDFTCLGDKIQEIIVSTSMRV